MTTLEEHKEAVDLGQHLSIKLESQASVKDWFSEAQKYVEFSVKVILVLGKYFFKDGKVYLPKLIFFWKYIGLITELYTLFSDFKKNN